MGAGVSHHAQQNARGKGDLVQSCKCTAEICRRDTLDVQRVQAHHQATEQAKDQSTHNKHFKGCRDFAHDHQRGTHHG